MEITEKEMFEISQAQKRAIKRSIKNRLKGLICANILRKAIDMIAFGDPRIGSDSLYSYVYKEVDTDRIINSAYEIYAIANGISESIVNDAIEKVL